MPEFEHTSSLDTDPASEDVWSLDTDPESEEACSLDMDPASEDPCPLDTDPGSEVACCFIRLTTRSTKRETLRIVIGPQNFLYMRRLEISSVYIPICKVRLYSANQWTIGDERGPASRGNRVFNLFLLVPALIISRSSIFNWSTLYQ